MSVLRHIWLFDGAEGGSFVETIQDHFKEKENGKSAAPSLVTSRAPSMSTSNSRAPSVAGLNGASVRSKSSDSDSQRSIKRMKSL